MAQARVPARERADRSRLGAPAMACGAGAGVLLIGSIFLPWAGSGLGSSIAAHRLADLVLARTVEAWVPQWVGLLVYLAPAGGAVVLLAAGLTGPARLRLTMAGWAVATTVTVGVVVGLPRRDALDLGAGLLLAIAGVVLGAVAVALLVVDHRAAGVPRPRRPTGPLLRWRSVARKVAGGKG